MWGKRLIWFLVGFGATCLGVLFVTSPANANVYDWRTGQFICSTAQCQISQAVSRGDISAATRAVQHLQQERNASQAEAFQRLVRNVETQRLTAPSAGSPAGQGVAPVSSTPEDRFAAEVVNFFVGVEASAAVAGTGRAVAPPPPPPSPYDLGCIASAPQIVVTYESRMPTFTWYTDCAGTYEYTWGYTIDGNVDLASYDRDHYERITGKSFTPPPPTDSRYNGVYFAMLNWKGVGPFDPFGSIGFSGWRPSNDVANRAYPAPVAILHEDIGELNQRRIAASSPTVPMIDGAPRWKRVSPTTLQVTGSPNTRYVVTARKNGRLIATWRLVTNGSGSAALRTGRLSDRIRLVVRLETPGALG